MCDRLELGLGLGDRGLGLGLGLGFAGLVTNLVTLKQEVGVVQGH